MNFSLLTLLLTPFLGGVLAYIGGLINKKVRFTFVFIFSVLTILIVSGYYTSKINSLIYGNFFGSPLLLQMNPLSWLLAAVISIIFLMSLLFSIPTMEETKHVNSYYLEMLFLEGTLIGVVLAGDLLTFFVFCEMMSWLTYFLVIKGTNESPQAAYKHIIMSLFGANSALVALVLVYLKTQSFSFYNISSAFLSQSPAFLTSVFILFAIDFLIKAGIVPLHKWLLDAHSEAPSSVSAIISGVLVEIGVYGLFFFLFFIFKVSLSKNILPDMFGDSVIFVLLKWIGSLSILFGTFLAIFQEDAKRMLAYSTIAQVGYIVLGLSLNSTLGTAGGLLQLVNYSIFQSLLIFALGAVIYRTGTKNLAEFGGLINKMPVSFIAMLLGAMLLIGIPLLNGFASKLMICQALFQKNNTLLLVIALTGVVGPFFYIYRLIHSLFFGKLSKKFYCVREAPLTMQIPMILLAFFALIFGLFPGIPLTAVAKVQELIGLTPIQFTLTEFPAIINTSILKILNISGTLLLGFIFVFILLFYLPKIQRLSKYDQYSKDKPVERSTKCKESFCFIRDRLNSIFKWFTGRVFIPFTKFLMALGEGISQFYEGDLSTYVSYIIFIMSAILLFVILRKRIL